MKIDICWQLHPASRISAAYSIGSASRVRLYNNGSHPPSHLIHQYFSYLPFPEFASTSQPSSSFDQQYQMTLISIFAYPSFPSPERRQRHYHRTIALTVIATHNLTTSPDCTSAYVYASKILMENGPLRLCASNRRSLNRLLQRNRTLQSGNREGVECLVGWGR